ncbi:putative minor capsid protein [Salibacterium aidingense]|uniref:putative minor capsid protein n=1 Tax=Salibacterium aidingense TaxID=384933 RepID=UPI003BBA0EA8
MVTIQPIPKNLLIHSVTYTEATEDNGGWNSGMTPAPVTIERVRVEPTSTLSRSSNRRDVNASHIIFIDHVHSSPFLRMKEGSTVNFDGKDWKVERVQTYYAFRSDPHHYEVELV